jgi:cobalt-zinc-cadmium efflux system protein
VSHDHAGHDHQHHHASAPERRLLAALLLTLLGMAGQIAGGLLSGSLALLSDAGHMLTDSASLALALVAQRVAARPRSHGQTYGSRRAETLAAFLNGLALVLASGWIAHEAFERWHTPARIDGPLMAAVAVGGLLVNLVAAWLLASGHGHNVNTRAALYHVLSDAGGSVAALIAAGLVMAFGWSRADSVVAVLLSLLILAGAWRLLQTSVRVLMEATPAGLPLPELERTIRETPGVADVHDLHAWTISDGFDIVTVHVVLDGQHHGTEVAAEVGRRVREGHGIQHVTVQPEAPQTQPVRIVPRRADQRRR